MTIQRLSQFRNLRYYMKLKSPSIRQVIVQEVEEEKEEPINEVELNQVDLN